MGTFNYKNVFNEWLNHYLKKWVPCVQCSEHETSDLTRKSSCSKGYTINSTDASTVPNGEIIEDPSTDGDDGKSLTWNSMMESHIVGRAQEKTRYY